MTPEEALAILAELMEPDQDALREWTAQSPKRDASALSFSIEVRKQGELLCTVEQEDGPGIAHLPESLAALGELAGRTLDLPELTACHLVVAAFSGGASNGAVAADWISQLLADSGDEDAIRSTLGAYEHGETPESMETA